MEVRMRSVVGWAAGFLVVAAVGVGWQAAGVGHAEAGRGEAPVSGLARVGLTGGGGDGASSGGVMGVAGVGGSLGGAAQRADGEHGRPWVWPTGSRVVVRPWEAPADDYAAGHRGIDVPASIGTPAVAVADGTVSFAGAVAGRSVVSVDHGGGLVSTLDSVSPEVTKGDAVSQGDVLGRVTVGHCPATDPCVHLGARLDDRYVDPTPYLPEAAWPVLLPESEWPG
ncbi:MAG: M23 family metallopeptidase [Curtobacterium sp.]